MQTKGNGSGVGNGVVVGKLYQPDGKTPAAGARVIIRPQNTLANKAIMAQPVRVPHGHV